MDGSTHNGHMVSARVDQPLTMSLQRVPLPEPSSGQVRIRLSGCGVCASNLPVWQGQPWFTYPLAPGQLGHEGWGVIDRVGPGVVGLEPGQPVTFLSEHAYAQFDVADAEKVVPLPPELAGKPFPGEPLGCAMNVLERSRIEPGQQVVIVGIGFLGALLTQLINRSGSRVVAVSRRPFSLDVARRCGASDLVAMDDHARVIERVRELTDGRMAGVVIEAVGQQWPLDLASELTAEGGHLVIAGYHQDGPRQVNMQQWNWRGLEVTNAHERQVQRYTRGIRQAIQAVMGGRLDPWWLMTHRYDLGQLDQAFEAMRARPEGFFKAAVAFGD